MALSCPWKGPWKIILETFLGWVELLQKFHDLDTPRCLKQSVSGISTTKKFSYILHDSFLIELFYSSDILPKIISYSFMIGKINQFFFFEKVFPSNSDSLRSFTESLQNRVVRYANGEKAFCGVWWSASSCTTSALLLIAQPVWGFVQSSSSGRSDLPMARW